MENEAYSKIVKLCGMEVAEVREQLSDLLIAQDKVQFDINGAFGEVVIRLSSEDENAREKIKSLIRELKVRFGSSIFTTKKNISLEQTIVDLLKEQKMTVSTVESCTGGLISARLTDVPGASEVFSQGFVTYSDRAKRKMVGVKKSTLKKYTAVSEQAAKEMAKGGAFVAEADACVSVTGYAGPDGGENGDPVGLVYIGCCVHDKVYVEEYHFVGDRASVRRQAVIHALTLLRKSILENYEI